MTILDDGLLLISQVAATMAEVNDNSQQPFQQKSQPITILYPPLSGGGESTRAATTTLTTTEGSTPTPCPKSYSPLKASASSSSTLDQNYLPNSSQNSLRRAQSYSTVCQGEVAHQHRMSPYPPPPPMGGIRGDRLSQYPNSTFNFHPIYPRPNASSSSSTVMPIMTAQYRHSVVPSVSPAHQYPVYQAGIYHVPLIQHPVLPIRPSSSGGLVTASPSFSGGFNIAANYSRPRGICDQSPQPRPAIATSHVQPQKYIKIEPSGGAVLSAAGTFGLETPVVPQALVQTLRLSQSTGDLPSRQNNSLDESADEEARENGIGEDGKFDFLKVKAETRRLRNRDAARRCRERKSAMVNEMERTRNQLVSDNESLRLRVQELEARLSEREAELKTWAAHQCVPYPCMRKEGAVVEDGNLKQRGPHVKC